MPYDGNGIASVAGQRPVNGQDTDAAQINVPLADIQSMLSQVLLKSGVAPMTGNLNLNGFKITGLGDATSNDEAVSFAQFTLAIQKSGVPTGAVEGFDAKTAPVGWVKRSGGTIGNAASGATARANEDTIDLFTHQWTNFDNTERPIQTSAGVATTRGASAAADFAANKRFPLGDSRTRFPRGADDGLNFDATLIPGTNQADAIKNHKHPGTTNNDGDHTHQFSRGIGGGGLGAEPGTDGATAGTTFGTGRHQHAFITDDNTGGSALETRPRSSVLLYCIKL